MSDSTAYKIKQFAELVNKGIEAWEAAGKILVSMIEENPNVRRAIIDEHPWVTSELLGTFERIGRRELYPQLLLDPSCGAQRLLSLPYDDQQKLHLAEVSVVVPLGGELVVVSKKIQKLTRKEAETAISETGVRPIAEQRELMRPRRVGNICSSVSPKIRSEPTEEDEVESLEDDPSETPDIHLAKAQSSLIRARELIEKAGAGGSSGQYIVQALNAIGALRFKLKDI